MVRMVPIGNSGNFQDTTIRGPIGNSGNFQERLAATIFFFEVSTVYMLTGIFATIVTSITTVTVRNNGCVNA